MSRQVRQPPYLPFLEGPPDTSPGLQRIDAADWLKPDTETDWLTPKRRLMLDQRGEVFAQLDTGVEAAREAGDMVFAYLGTETQSDWPTKLEAAATEVSDDLCVLTCNDRGDWCLVAASLCAPTFWSLKEKLGQPLLGLHAPVPGAGDLSARIHRIFSGLRPDLIMERFNWTVQAGPDRFTPSAAPLKAHANETPVSAALDILHLRVERQTIRRLPVSGGVLFTIRVCIDPLRAALQTGKARTAFAKAWRGADPALAAYKGWPAYTRLVEGILES